jgi:hypothetical protein
MALKDWSSTAASNTSIDTINIAENAPFANMNDMGRAIMANVRAEVADQGTTVTAAAVATISGTSQFKLLSGATTISAFDTAVTGLYREVLAGTTLTLAPTTALGLDAYGSLVSLSPGDQIRARSMGAGNWRTYIARANGEPGDRVWEQEGAGTVTAATLTDISVANPVAPMAGSTTIDGFSTAVTGAYRELRVLGTPLLKHNATSNIVPGGANVTLAANDLIRARSLGAGNWMHKIDRGDGTSLVVAASASTTKYTGSYATNADLTTAIPLDDTTPTSSEGTQVISVGSVVVPTTTARVRGVFTAPLGSAQTSTPIVAIFRGTTCIAVGMSRMIVGIGGAQSVGEFILSFNDLPGSAATFTYSVRVGADTGTIRLNGNTAGRYFGGTAKAVLDLEVYEP